MHSKFTDPAQHLMTAESDTGSIADYPYDLCDLCNLSHICYLYDLCDLYDLYDLCDLSEVCIFFETQQTAAEQPSAD